MIYTTLVLLLCTLTAAQSEDDKHYDSQLEIEWQQRMKDFSPNDYLTVQLEANDEIDLFA